MKKYAFLVVCLTARLAVAADAPAPTPAAGSGDSSLKFEQNTNLTDSEKENRSAAAVQKMRQVLKTVLGILEEARNSKDIVRLNCVNEKLTQVKGFIRIAEQADVSLQEAVAKQEAGAANHEFTKIEVASQRVDQLRAEAEACNGSTNYENGNSGAGASVVTTEPSDLPSNTIASAAPAPSVTVTPPPPATQSAQ